MNKNRPYKYVINETIEDCGRSLTILERERRKRESLTKNEMVKWYRCKCHRCGTNDAWINESRLKEGRGCPVCHSKKVSIGINDIPTTAPWMVQYFQGGYDEAKLYTKSSNKMIYPVCPDCGGVSTKSYSINYIYEKHGNSCSCSDGISFPEKFMFFVLKYLNVKFQTQLTKTTFSWCGNFKYDFYIPEFNCIIETHGEQHYKDCSWCNYNDVHKNDILKKNLAKQNGITHYVVLDCRKSEVGWIKKSIINSIIPKLINFTDIDVNWNSVEESSLKNIIKSVCDFKNSNPKMTATDIVHYFNIDRSTIGKYLHKGEKLGWCTYNGCSKFVEIFKDGISLGKYRSAKELSDLSVNDFGVFFHPELIKRVCRKENDIYKEYYFEYTYDLKTA